jgi:membrane associated rhomboid family serine protease
MADHSNTTDPSSQDARRRKQTAEGLVFFPVTGASLCTFLFGRRWLDDYIPLSVQTLFFGLIVGLCLGYIFGRRDVLRTLGPQDLPAWRQPKRTDPVALFKYAAYLLVLSPFAVFIMPVKVWRKSRADGDTTFLCLQHAAAAGVIGLMISLLVVVIVAAAFGIALGR